MKRCLPFLLLFVWSCSSITPTGNDDEDDVFWDFICWNVGFVVSDSEGNNLLSPDTPGNLLDQGLYVTYRGEKFELQQEELSRYLPPRTLGLRYRELETKQTVLYFGEFTPTRNYMGESFVIHWGDGTQDKIEFDLYITWNKKDPTVHKVVYMNGRMYSDQSLGIEIIK